MATVRREPKQPSDGRLWRPWAPAGPASRVFVEGRAGVLIDAEGRRYLDGSAGALNVAIGYRHPVVVEAIAEQAARLAYVDLSEAAADRSLELAGLLGELAPGGLERTLFTNSGSEAAEAAVKITRMFHALCGDPERRVIVSFADAYHGTTAAALAATGSSFRRALAGPFPDGFAHVRELTVQAVEAVVAEIGPGRIAAVLVEPVLGVGGIVPLPPELLAGVRRLCDATGALLVADEVMTGFGRTGELFAVDHDGVVPDLLLTGKQLAGGYAPLAAVTATAPIHEAFGGDPKLGGLRHGHTSSGHPIACAAALAVQQVIAGDGLVKHAAGLAKQLHRLIGPLEAMAPVRQVRGLGLLAGVEYQDDAVAGRVVEGCYERGVRLRAIGPVVQVAPPLNAEPVHLVQIAAALADATTTQASTLAAES